MANILGLNLGHDGSAAIVKNGKLVAALAQEKITKLKKDEGISKELIETVLSQADLSLEDIDAVALAEYYVEGSGEIFSISSDSGPIDNTREYVLDDNYSFLSGTLLGKKIGVYVVGHHMAHAASAFYTSNFDEALCITLDSSGGSFEGNSLIAIGNKNYLEYQECPGLMIGNAYSIFTSQLQLGPPFIKAGSTMGLAAYGKPQDHIVKNIKRYVKNSYFNYNYFKYYDDLWVDSFGKLDSSLKVGNANDFSSYKNKEKIYETFEGRRSAADVQYVFENAVMDMIKNASKKYKLKNICLSGGSFLNCNVNSLIRDSGLFDNIHHFPAAGDDGLCVGSALYIAHQHFNDNRHDYSVPEVAYLGTGKDSKRSPSKKIAKIIADGGIVAWFSGKSEYGPRALGHRSLLADPRNFHNREIINFAIKKREWFRPFAPSVLEEFAGDWFKPGTPSPYMLYTQVVKRPQEIPAVTHVDNTARIQTVNRNDNPEYYDLIKEFYKITGVPMVLNTSLNGQGQPILETEKDALDFFANNKEVSVLVLNGELITREKFDKKNGVG
jgi:carbamoyltransferase